MPSPRRRPPDGFNPGCESRLERSLWWLSIVVVLTLVVWPLAAAFLIGPSVSSVWMFGPAAAAIAASITLHHLVSRRSRGEVFAANFLLCPDCRYPLGALPPTGTCPECGSPFTHDRVRECWKRTLDESWRN